METQTTIAPVKLEGNVTPPALGSRNALLASAILLPALTHPLPIIHFFGELMAVTLILTLTRRGHLWLATGAVCASLALGTSLPIGVPDWTMRLIFVGRALVPALFFGLMWRRVDSPGNAFWLTGGLIALLVTLLFASVGEAIYESIDTMQSMLVEALPLMAESMSESFVLLKWLLPAGVALSVLAPVFFGWLIVSYFFTERVERKSLTAWRLSYGVLVLVFVAGAGRLISSSLDAETITMICDNALFALLFAFALGGFSLSEHGMRLRKTHWAARSLFYLGILLLMHYGLVLLALLGLFDTQFDLRTRIEPSQ